MGILDGFSDLFTGGNSSRAQDYSDQAVGQYDDLQAPRPEDLQSIIQGYVQSGQLSPESAQAFLADPSAMTSISTDPALKDAQSNALKSLQDLSKGGLSLQDKADLSRISTDEGTKARGARDAVLQNAAARGAGGGGLELLNQMKANQDAATNTSQRDLDVAGGAQQRALAALAGAGNLAGNIQNQDFNQKAQVAGAQDAISKFNASQNQAVGLTNTAARNAAAATNLASSQHVADSRIDAANQTAAAKAKANQAAFDNSLNVAGAKSGAFGKAANQATAAGEQNSKLLGTGIASAATLSDKNLKEHVEEFDPGAFLDSITGYKYNYKPEHGLPPGKQVGIMAQDLEKEVPQLVENTSMGKQIDYNKAGGPIMASLADLHDRLKRLEG